MSITAISRDLTQNPNIVHVLATDTLAQVVADDYVLSQADEIAALNNGVWEWLAGDIIAMQASDGNTWLQFSGSDFDTFVAMPVGGGLSTSLLSGRIFVGNAGNIATGVAMSGAATIDNAGVVSLANNAVLSANLSPLALKYAAVTISAAQFNGMYAAPKLLVAAGGANTLVVLKQAQLVMTYGSANYAAGGVAAIQWAATANGAGIIASNTYSAATFQAAASTAWNFNPGVVPETLATVTNQGLYLSNITGAFTTGDSAMVMHLWYAVIPTV